MRAAWYEKQGPAREVLVVGEMPEPHPAAGEVRIRIAASGINPGDIKKRQDSFGVGMRNARPTIHSLRHSFAVRALETCPDGRDRITKHMVALSTYLGHSKVADTTSGVSRVGTRSQSALRSAC